MKVLKPFLLLLYPFLILPSCDLIDQQSSAQNGHDPQELIDAEKRFSQMSSERGMREAFLHYIADNGVLLRPDKEPIHGADAIEYLSQVDDADFQITWIPQKAEISSDGSLGFTYGIYNIEVNETIIKGTYVNVWKRQRGEWHFLVNSGNQGIGK